MELIKPQDITRGMVIADEVNESAYTVLDTEETTTGNFYVKGLALTNWGSLIQKNFSYLPNDGEIYVVCRPAPFALPSLPARDCTVETFIGSDSDVSSLHYGDGE